MEEEHDISEEEAAIEIEEAEMDIEEAEMDFEQGTQTETDDDQKPDTEDNVLECGEELKKDDLNEDEALAALAGLANEEDFKVPQGDNSTWQADRLGEITVTGNGKSFSEYCVRHDGSKLRVGTTVQKVCLFYAFRMSLILDPKNKIVERCTFHIVRVAHR